MKDGKIEIVSRDRNLNLKDEEKYVPPHEYQNPNDSEGERSKDFLSCILNKIEGS